MTYIGQAKTPTLIQHGELDRRVPIANAFELRQGLEDRGVPWRWWSTKASATAITKPKAMRAVMDHNPAGSTTPLRRPGARPDPAGAVRGRPHAAGHEAVTAEKGSERKRPID